MKTEVIPGPYRVCEEKHDDGTLIIRSDPRGGGDVPGDLVVALIVGGAPGEYDRNTAELLASAPALRAENEQLRRLLGAVLEDTARLDWLSENLSYVMLARKDRLAMSQLENNGDGWTGNRLREALDNARK